MGIILRPKTDTKPLSAKQIVERLNDEGIRARFERFAEGSWIVFGDPSLHEEQGLSFGDDQLWIGECYPTDDDALSVLIMRIAKLIDYDAEGE